MSNLKMIAVLLFSLPLLLSCEDRQKISTGYAVKRVGMVTGIKPEKIAYYKKLHAAAWEGVLKTIHANNIRNYTIYLKKIDTAYFLFSNYEYVGKDYVADMKRIGKDSVTQRWWRETAPCQIPLPEAAAKAETWTEMEEVFHTD